MKNSKLLLKARQNCSDTSTSEISREQKPHQLLSNYISERTFRTLKENNPAQQQCCYNHHAQRHNSKGVALLAQEGPAKSLDHARHGIKTVKQAPLLRNQAD